MTFSHEKVSEFLEELYSIFKATYNKEFGKVKEEFSHTYEQVKEKVEDLNIMHKDEKHVVRYKTFIGLIRLLQVLIAYSQSENVRKSVEEVSDVTDVLLKDFIEKLEVEERIRLKMEDYESQITQTTINTYLRHERYFWKAFEHYYGIAKKLVDVLPKESLEPEVKNLEYAEVNKAQV